jgi:hypothetical protein
VTTSPTHRPLSITLLAWFVLVVTILNLLRLVMTLRNWEFLAGLLPMSPVYLALSGLSWCLLGFPLTWGIWLGKSWAPKFTLISIIAYSIYYWSDRLFAPGYPQRSSGSYSFIGLNLLIAMWSLWILSRPNARKFFGEINEQKK